MFSPFPSLLAQFLSHASHFCFCKLSIAPSQQLPALQRHSMTPIHAIPHYPHQALKMSWLAAIPGIIPQRFFKAPALASGCVWIPGRGQGAGPPDVPAEFKVLHWRAFPGLTGMLSPCRVHRGPDAMRGEIPGCLLSAQRNFEVTWHWGHKGANGFMGLRDPD